VSTIPCPIEECIVPSPNWQSRWQMLGKRTIDIVGVLFVLLFFPLWVVIAIGIKLSSPGPVFHCCHWIGKDRIPFDGYKFRSMVANADALKTQLLARNEMSGPVFKITRDPRITRFGAWLRRYSLDEIPQLYSVLKGDMSLVGPRPPLRTEYEKYEEWHKQKLLVKPGVTCLWQVSGRNRICDFDEWVNLDLEYIQKWSLGLDIRILVKTCGEVMTGSGK
jgi:lipopolysaccharide/colanic/teichoic acid biosynthesis glycosyltransferase